MSLKSINFLFIFVYKLYILGIETKEKKNSGHFVKKNLGLCETL